MIKKNPRILYFDPGNMDQESQSNRQSRRHPMSVVREHMWKRLVRPTAKYTKISPTIWECQITCGPYTEFGKGMTKEIALIKAAKAHTKTFKEINTLPWINTRLRPNGWNAEAMDQVERMWVRTILSRIEGRVLLGRHKWTSVSAMFFREELAILIKSEGGDIRETKYLGRKESLIVWELTLEPRIIEVATGTNVDQIRYKLLLKCIKTLRERCQEFKRAERFGNLLSLPKEQGIIMERQEGNE